MINQVLNLVIMIPRSQKEIFITDGKDREISGSFANINAPNRPPNCLRGHLMDGDS